MNHYEDRNVIDNRRQQLKGNQDFETWAASPEGLAKAAKQDAIVEKMVRGADNAANLELLRYLAPRDTSCPEHGSNGHCYDCDDQREQMDQFLRDERKPGGWGGSDGILG